MQPEIDRQDVAVAAAFIALTSALIFVVATSIAAGDRWGFFVGLAVSGFGIALLSTIVLIVVGQLQDGTEETW